MNNFIEIIDYSYLGNFDSHLLQNSIVLPIKSDGIYFYCYICEDSNIELLEIKNLLIRSIYLKKEDILFFLSDINFRKKLYKNSINILENSKLSENLIQNFFEDLIKKAIVLRCSDIHFESFEKSLVIRFRIDGILKTFYMFKKDISFSISSFIKMISKLDVTQYRIPMDGGFSLKFDSKSYDFRVSTMPTIYGESIVIRILDNYNIKKDIKNLGFSKNIYNHLEDMCLLNQGLVLITGPTGSGKSTTLYSLINRLNNGSKKIITIEDPVEYKIEEIQQIEINEDLGLSFDTVLKNILRQDPDVILIGEIRDTKSLSIALQASLTGHLVLASIHANNSIETLSRLIDLKSDYYLLASCLKYIVSQRLVLNICKHCNNIGCIKCSFRGLLGRSSIAEVLKVDKNISSMILKNENIDSIKTYIYKSSFRTIFDDGKEKIKNMETTLDEVYKVIDSDEI